MLFGADGKLCVSTFGGNGDEVNGPTDHGPGTGIYLFFFSRFACS